MTPLRQNFIRELVLRGTSPRTQESYIAAVYGLARHYHRAPDQLGDEELKDYLFYLATERKLAPSSVNVTVCGLRALYRLLFQSASQTLLQFGQQRWGAQLGITAVLHTWSQPLLDHLSR